VELGVLHCASSCRRNRKWCREVLIPAEAVGVWPGEEGLLEYLLASENFREKNIQSVSFCT